MQPRLALVALLAILASGCSSPAPKPEMPIPTPTPVVDQGPQPPEGAVPCPGPVTAGPPSISILFGEVFMPLPMSDCAIALPAGPVTLYLLINNLQQQVPVQVTGAPAGRWEGERYRVEFDLAPGEVHELTLDMGGLSAQNPLTYTFRGGPAIESLFASGPSRQGPWTAVQGDIVPPEHGWLRIQYPRPMPAGRSSIITDDQYAFQVGLPGEWEGSQVQYVAISERKPVLFVLQTADEHGLQIFPQSGRRLYRGAPPELARLNPATGALQTVYRSNAVPGQLALANGQVLWWSGQDLIALDPATGRSQPAEWPAPVPTDGLSFPSLDGQMVAAFDYPVGDHIHPMDHRSQSVSLTIRESGSSKTLLQLDGALTTWGSFSCSRGTPALAWRPDGQALAFLDAPTQDQLLLKELGVDGTIRTVAEWSGAGAGLAQTDAVIDWAPSGRLLVVGSRLVEAATGRTLAEKLPERTFWSPDSRYLLLHLPDHPFTAWGTVGLLNVESGARLELGHGQGLGWTPQGEALLVRWEVSKEIPPPGKGCP